MTGELGNLGLLATPFAAGLLVLATHVPLGIEVLRRNIIFIDLAIAQVAALGVLAAAPFGIHDILGGAGTQLAAGIAALIAAAALAWAEKRWPDIQEALIGLLFVLAAAGGILLLAGNPHGGEHLRDILVGQILWASWEQLASIAVLYAVVLAVWIFAGSAAARNGFVFYALFALAVTASVQLVGVLLVFASLIAPAVATRPLLGMKRLSVAFCLGAVSYAAGLAASLAADLPAGAAIVCTLVIVAYGCLWGQRLRDSQRSRHRF